MKIDLSICIVNFNTANLLKKCLESIYKNTSGINFEIITVDNGSTDDSAKTIKTLFPKVKIISKKTNVFFSKGYNLALKTSRGKYCLILNSDTIIHKNTLKKIFQFMELNPQIAASSCLQTDMDGKIDKTCSQFPSPIVEFLESSILTKLFKNVGILKKYRYKKWNRKSDKIVDVIPGSFIFIRRDILQHVDYFDENLLLFYGENDLCKRIKKTDKNIYYFSGAKITHLRAQSVNLLPKWELYSIARSDMLYYYKKHFGTVWWLFLLIALSPNWLYWRLKSFK